MVIIHRKTTVQ